VADQQQPDDTTSTTAPGAPSTNVPSTESTTTTTAPPARAGRTIDDRGITVQVPPGWEGEIYRRAPESIEYDDRVPPARRRQETTRSVVHLGNFPLPEGRGDYGSGAVEIMGNRHVLVIVFEFEPDSATQPMFAASGIPGPLDPDDFDPDQMQRPLAGMAGVQRFFNVDRQRAFCLFAVIGSYDGRRQLTPLVNDVLAGMAIAP
jgi:hypothetical protein